MQVSGIGRVAAQPEGLAASRRRHLPGGRILQRRDECTTFWRRYLQRHFDKPGVDGCKRKLFGMQNPGDAWESPVAACRCLRRQHYTYQQCCRGTGVFHVLFSVGDMFPMTKSERRLLGAGTEIKLHVSIDRIDAVVVWRCVVRTAE